MFQDAEQAKTQESQEGESSAPAPTNSEEAEYSAAAKTQTDGAADGESGAEVEASEVTAEEEGAKQQDEAPASGGRGWGMGLGWLTSRGSRRGAVESVLQILTS